MGGLRDDNLMVSKRGYGGKALEATVAPERSRLESYVMEASR